MKGKSKDPNNNINACCFECNFHGEAIVRFALIAHLTQDLVHEVFIVVITEIKCRICSCSTVAPRGGSSLNALMAMMMRVMSVMPMQFIALL